MLDKIYTTLFIALMVAAAGSAVTNMKLLRYLKKNQRPVWDALGQPSFFNNSMRNSWRSTKFYFTRAYNRIEDPTAVRLGRRAYVFFILCWVLFLSIFIAGPVFSAFLRS